jgi:hypothetical protein
MILELIMAILATYRLANLLPGDDGPFFIFTRIRNYARRKAVLSYCVSNSVKDEILELVFEPHEVTVAMLLSDDNKDLGLWANVFKGITCAYCCGLYAAIFVSILVIWNNFYGNLFILVFAIAGGQSLLQKWSEK